MLGNPAPGYQKRPNHVVATAPFDGAVRIEFGGETIAETRRALSLEETNHPTAFYIPRDDVRMDLATQTDHATYCPFKGEASYYSFKVGDAEAVNAAWSYEAPYDECADLKDYLAFYPARVDAVSVG